MRRMLFMMAAGLLAGCATTEAVWVKPGAGDAEFYADRGQCQAQAFSVPGAPALQIALVFSGCMQGHGWHTEDRPIRR